MTPPCTDDVRRGLRAAAALLADLSAEAMEEAEAHLRAALEAARNLAAEGRLRPESFDLDLTTCRAMISTANGHCERRRAAALQASRAETRERTWFA